MSHTLALIGVAAALLLPLYAYALYPLLLALAGRRGRTPPRADGPWPRVSITVPVYNEEAEIADTLEALLALDYPADRRQVLVVSDASTDRTDEIVRGFADRGVELLRMPARGGKTAAETAAGSRLTGEIVINTDASIRILPGSLRALVAAFADPLVGLASGRDVSVARVNAAANPGEGRYVGYEMWVRRLETRAGGIVGASGCFYAIRAHLHRTELPAALSRDFAAALISRRAGFRAVSVDEAVCLVPRVGSQRREYQRKVRTIARGMQTLWHLRELANPLRHGAFAWRLISHKVCRWMVPWAALCGAAGLLVLAPGRGWVVAASAAIVAGCGLALLGARWPERGGIPRLLATPAFAAAGNLAALHATVWALQGTHAVWEPTRRERAQAPA